MFLLKISLTIANVNNSISPANRKFLLPKYDLECQRHVNNRAINSFTCYFRKSCNCLHWFKSASNSCHISNVNLFTSENNITQNKEHSAVKEC